MAYADDQPRRRIIKLNESEYNIKSYKKRSRSLGNSIMNLFDDIKGKK